MDEGVWLSSGDSDALWGYVYQPGRAARKGRLLAVACCRRCWEFLPDPRHRHAVEVAERFADGLATDAEREQAYREATAARWEISGGRSDLHHAAKASAWSLDAEVNCPLPYVYYICGADDWAEQLENRAQADLIRDIYGNPFRPVTIDPAWLTSTVEALAAGIYDERAFDRLPIPADALQDAGCDSGDLLTRLSDPTATHVRGCWALDLVLGKE